MCRLWIQLGELVAGTVQQSDLSSVGNEALQRSLVARPPPEREQEFGLGQGLVLQLGSGWGLPLQVAHRLILHRSAVCTS